MAMGDYEPNPHQRSVHQKHIGSRERGRYGKAPAGWPWGIHPLQRKSHPPETLPNHCVGLPSFVVPRGASIVTRQEANDESW